MKKYLGIPLFVILLTLNACHSNSSYENKAMVDYSHDGMEDHTYATQTSNESGALDQDESAGQNEIPLERKIIKTASIKFQVKDLKESTKKIETVADKYKGMISSMNQRNSNYAINNSLIIRIPSEKLDQFMNEITTESIHTDYTKVNAQDVTEEYVDITSRLSTKKEVRDRYVEILRKKAKTVKDILEAEEKIRVIQEEIESIEGRLKYLRNKTALSTITIEIYQEVAYVKAPNIYKKSFLTKLKEGFIDGWELIQDIALGIVSIWPILLILTLLFFSRKRIRNMFRR